MMKKKIKDRFCFKIILLYAILLIIFSAFIFIRYLFLVDSGEAMSIKQIKEIRAKEKLEKKNTIILDKDSIINKKDSIIIHL